MKMNMLMRNDALLSYHCETEQHRQQMQLAPRSMYCRCKLFMFMNDPIFIFARVRTRQKNGRFSTIWVFIYELQKKTTKKNVQLHLILFWNSNILTAICSCCEKKEKRGKEGKKQWNIMAVLMWLHGLVINYLSSFKNVHLMRKIRRKGFKFSV